MVTSSSLRAAIAAVALLLLFPGPGVSTAASAPSPTRFECSAEARSYPDRWAAEGATFVGRVLSVRKLADEFRVVRFAVQKVHAGDIGDRVVVRTACVTTRFRVGERYLVSSSAFRPTSGRIDAIGFGSYRSVAWHIRDDGSISLLGYGPGLGGPAKPYLTNPDTLWEAAHAVAYGIKKEGKCVGGDDNKKATWGMEVDRINGRLEVVAAMEHGKADRVWTIDLYQDYVPFLHRTIAANSEFEVVRLRTDTSGPDRFGFRARQADGEVCRGVITY